MLSVRNQTRTSRLRASPILLAVTILAMLSISGFSSAHLPIYASGGPTMDSALKIPDANVSYGITAEFSSSTNRIQFYAFSVEAGHVLNYQLGVPAISSLEDFAPVVVLLGPGLPNPDGFTAGLLAEFNITISSGDGATSYVYNGTKNVIDFEPFTQVNIWDRQDAEVTLPSQAVYYLAVAVPYGWEHDATSGFGKYILAPGVVEKFTIIDYMAIPLDWIRWHSFWEQSVPLLMLPTFFVVIIGTVTTWQCVRMKKPEMFEGMSGGAKIAFYLGVVGATLMVGSAINQLALLFGYTMFSLKPADYIELMLQTIGLVLGVLAFRMNFRFIRFRSKGRVMIILVLTIVVVFGALTVGAGWLAGPVLFLCACFAALFLAHLPRQKPAESST